MIFADSVKKSRVLAIYLWIFLLDKLKDKDENIIQSFSSILEVTTKTDWLEKFFTGDTRIIICMDNIEMGVDIPDIKHVI